MKSKWNSCQLGDVLELKRGYDLPNRHREDGEIPIISSSGITGYHSEAKVSAPGVVTGRYGTLGKVFFINQDFWPLNTTLYVKDFKGNDPLFLSYFLKTLNFSNQNVAGAVPGVNRNYLHIMDVTIPEIQLQQKIASILSTYDDLIENNTRRIKILEEMAQRIYREWFVHFRFPDHEKVKMVESELGMIPDGWEVESINEIKYFNFINANVTPYEDKKEYFATANIEGTKIIKQGIWYEHKNKPSRAQKQPVIFSVWFARMKDTFKVLGFSEINKNLAEKSILSSGFAGFKSEKDVFGFLYYTINSEHFHILKDIYCTGATQMSLTNEGLKKINTIVPPENLIHKFSSTVNPMIDTCLLLEKSNQNLRQTRDLLLPKLISGKIDVEDLDIDTGELVA